MDTNSIEAQPNLAPTPDQGNTLEIPQKVKPSANDPFQPREALIRALIGRESSGNSKAIGKAGERGLMQVRPETAAQYGYKPEQLSDPAIQQQAGTRYLSDMLKRYKGNEFLALVAYNSGPGRVDKGQLLPQSVKYATKILQASKQGQPDGTRPTMQAQLGGTTKAPDPSMLSRIGGAVGNFFEGTANAEELPPSPSGRKVVSGDSVPSAAPTVEPPSMMPPTDAGATAGELPPSPGGRRVFDPSHYKASISMGASGPRINMQEIQPTTAARTQEMQADIATKQVDDAMKFYDQKIQPREGEFTGSLMSNPSGAIKGFSQWPEYSHSRYTSLVGGQGDPDVKNFYAKIGPLQAAQLRGLIGGRIGQGMSEYLGPHLPDPSKDDLPTMRQKLGALKQNLPIVLQEIKRMQGQGMDDESIANTIQSLPYDDGSGGATGGEPPPPPGFQ